MDLTPPGIRKKGHQTGLTALCDLAIKCFGADTDFKGNHPPIALFGQHAIMPRDPGIKPLSHCSQSQDFRTLAGCLHLARQMRGKCDCHLIVIGKMGFNITFADHFDLRILMADSVTMVGGRKQ